MKSSFLKGPVRTHHVGHKGLSDRAMVAPIPRSYPEFNLPSRAQNVVARTASVPFTPSSSEPAKEAAAVPPPVTTGNIVDAPKVRSDGKVREVIPEFDPAKLHDTLVKAKAAQAKFAEYTQEQVDKIFHDAAQAACSERLALARLAVAETRMGVVEDKILKNHFASEFVYNKYKHDKTCGVIEYDPLTGIQKIAEPVGVIAGIVPVTNPTATAIFKSLIALKTRNCIVLCPHPLAAKATTAAARIVRDAAIAAGAPEDCISWVEHPSIQASQALMQAPEISMILATGGPAMVHAAYSSGHPALGVGPGNTPAIIDETADINLAVSSILLSKTFDNGVICASEQSVVIVASVYDKVRAEFARRGAWFLNEEEKNKARSGIVKYGKLNPSIVGQPVSRLAEIFGLSKAPPGARVIIGEVENIGHTEAFAHEKMSPILGMYKAENFEQAVQMAHELVMFGGPGHTSALYTNPLNKDRIQAFGLKLKTVRLLINTPSLHGAMGDQFNAMDPSLTMGCGTWAGSSVSANVGIKHLMNYKHVLVRQESMLWFRVPPVIFFMGGCLGMGLKTLYGKQRAFIVTDKSLFDLGYCDQITHILDTLGMHHEIYHNVAAEPTMTCISEGVKAINDFKPDVIIGLGGGSSMDAAKMMWLMYEQPDTNIKGLSQRFMDPAKRIYEMPQMLGAKAMMVTIPTTSGTGSEVSPFAVVTDAKTGVKYSLVAPALTPHIAIVDPHLVVNIPKKLTAWGGIDALVHAIESYVSVAANDYTRGLSLQAIRIIFDYLPRAYEFGAKDYEAREKMHYAACIAGMAMSNAFLGACHSMAHVLGAKYHIPHGLSNALLISHVIRYNSSDRPFKVASFPSYRYPHAKADYAEIADQLKLGGSTHDEKVVLLLEAIEGLKKKLDMAATIKEIVGAAKEGEYLSSVNTMAEAAWDDQNTGANPRSPLLSDFARIYTDAWSEPILPLKFTDFISDGNFHT